MDNQQRLFEYLDGGLDQQGEEDLFRALSESPDLRRELTDHLRISEAVRQDSRSIAVPTDVTNAVFAELGFVRESKPQSPVVIPASVAAPRQLLSILAGTAAAVVLFVSHQPPASAPVADIAEATTPEITPRGTTEGSIPLPSSGDDVVDMKAKLSGRRSGGSGNEVLAGDIPPAHSAPEVVAKDEAHSEKQVPIAREDVIGSVIASSAIVPAADEPLAIAQMPQQSAPAAPTAQMFNPPVSVSEGEVPSFTMLVRGFSTGAYPNDIPVSGGQSFGDNMALSLHYSLNREHSVGIEFGQEHFSKRFDAIDNFGRRTAVAVSERAAWFGASYRFSMRTVGDLYPTASLLLGATESGLLTRTSVGMSYQPSNAVIFTVGVEGSLLRFKSPAGEWYSSPALGVTYGMGILF